MKRILPLLLLALLFASCATSKKTVQCLPAHQDVDRIKEKIWNLCSNCPDFPLCIIEDPEPIAAIDSKNSIALSTGLLAVSSTPGQEVFLDCVLAHELSHYTLNHFAKQNILSTTASIGLSIANAFIPGIGYADYLINPTLTSVFSRSQELDADTNAVRMLRNAFVSKPQEEYLNFLLYFQEHVPHKKSIWATHPSWEDRIEAVKKEN